MAIQQLDLGAVYNTLAQKRSQDLQAQQIGQQGQMNALQMARYQREDATAEKQQSALSRLASLDPNDAAGKRSILAEAFPELAAREAFREGDFRIGPDGTVIDGHTGRVVSAPQVLDGETSPAPAPQARPTLAPGARGPVPLPVQREELPPHTSGSGAMPPKSNNVGNIRTSAGNAWQGKVTPEGEAFEHFDTPENGVRATARLLTNYAKQGTNTLRGIVAKWAPPNENQTDALIVNAAKRAGFDPDQPLDLTDPATLEKVTRAIIVQEQGKITLGDDVIRGGVTSALGQGQPPGQPAPPRTAAGNQEVIKMFGDELGTQLLGEERRNPNALLSDVLPHEIIEANPHLQGMTISQARQAMEGRLAAPPQPAPQQQAAPQPPGDEGFTRVRSTKSLGLADPPAGMMWVGRRRPDGSIETKVAPIPGAPDDRADKRSDENFDQETKLRTEHQGLVKGFDVAQTNYAAMPELAADDTGGSDIALVNAFFKTFAPDSTVMEGEFAMAGKAAGLPDRITNLFQKAMEGDVLSPQQRQELITAAGRFYNQRKASVESANEKYTKLAQSYTGVNADRVVINPIRDLPKHEPKPKEEKKVADAGEIPTFSSPTDPALAALPSGAQFRDPNGVLRRKP
jgi:hypothetical protein